MSRVFEQNGSLRILMVVPYFPMPVRGGLEKQAWLLARSLVQDGHHVLIVARHFHLKHKMTERVNGMDVSRLSFGSGPLRFFNGLYQLLIPFFLFSRRDEFDIVHVHTMKIAGLIALVVAKLMGKKTLQKIPRTGTYGISERLNVFIDPVRHYLYRLSADSVAAMSENCVEEMKLNGYPEARIFRITNGVEIGNQLPDTANSGREMVKVVFLGRLIARKGILDLLDAWKMVADMGAEQCSTLEIYGKGPAESGIRKIITDRKMDGSVKLCGHVDDVQRVLSAADILVLPSYGEGNSNSVLEAMAAGLPVASTTVGGTASLVGEAGRIFLFDPGDVKRLSEILLRLIRDRGLRTSTGKKMRERAEKHFSIHAIKDKYVLAYRLLLAGNRDRIWNCSEYPPE